MPNPWNAHRVALRQHMVKDPWNRFLRWSTIQATMWVGDAWYIDQEYAALPPEWKALLHPEGFGATNLKRYHTSGNLIHQAYHLALWEQTSGRKLADLETIIEIGGGYGALAKLVAARGFTGKLYVYDLPEMLELQQHYLRGLPQYVPVPDASNLPQQADLIISLYALCELPLDLRETLVADLHPESWYLVYQETYDDLNNSAYFTAFILAHKEYQWQTLPVAGFVNHHYLIGRK